VKIGKQLLKMGVPLAGVLMVAGSLFANGVDVAGASSSGQPSLKSLKGQTIVEASWGGVYTQAEKKDLWDPFTKATGIKVEAVINGSDPSIPAILGEQTHNQTIDLVTPLNPAIMISKGEIQQFPSWLLATFKKYLRPTAYTKNYMEASDTSTVIACNPAVMKKCPLTPAEFFNVKEYPGPRAIVNDPTEAIPMALEALGVPSDQLGGALNVSKAMKELKKIKPYISSWPDSGSQQQQLLTDKSVGAEIMWNGRAFVVQQTIPKLIISWSGALLPEPQGYIVTKHAPNLQATFAYFAWLAEHPKNQAKWVETMTYPMPAKNLNSYLPANIAAALPVGKKVTITSNLWDAQNETLLANTWQSFLG
jgi:putative spermidine/putrescine transport system substrate-binding protein